MAVDQTHKFCGRCKANTIHYRHATNHILHLLLTICLCGWWLPIWILLSIKVGGWKCETCGYGGNPLVQLVVMLASACLLVGGCVAIISSIDIPEQSPHSPQPQSSPEDKPTPTEPPLEVETEPVAEPEAEVVPELPVDPLSEPMLPTEPSAPITPEAPEPEYRTWTDSSYTFRVEAIFQGMAFGKVKLRKRDGTVVEIPLETLSFKDRQWIKNRR